MKQCAVVGSINMDLVVRAARFPAPGETLLGMQFETLPGGKGANQAIALARLGIPVRMAGMVGDDAFGKAYMEHLKAGRVDTSCVSTVKELTTGIADIIINDQGENSIIAVPGANGACDVRWMDGVAARLADCDVFLLQLELPLEAVGHLVMRLRKMGRTIILDPAPAVSVPGEVLKAVDYLTPNETELQILTGHMPPDTGMRERVEALHRDFSCTVIHKHGKEGAYICDGEGFRHVPGFAVEVVDTTAAGDTFNAGFTAGLMQGLTTDEAVRMANAAGTLAVTTFGAQQGMPSMAELMDFMRLHEGSASVE